MRVAAVLGGGEQRVVVEPDRRPRAGRRRERAVEARADTHAVVAAVDRDHADLGVLRVDQRVVEAEEGDAACRRATPTATVGAGLLGEGADLALERDDVEVVGEVAVPALVACAPT